MNHKQLVQQMADMKAELDTLRTQVTSYENVEEAPAPTANGTSSRRKLLKRMAIAGIGGIGALGLAATVGSNNTVLAETSSNNAIEATGGADGYGLKVSGGVAPLMLIGGSSAGAPTTGNHTKGELYVDNAGALYYNINGTGTGVGTWRQLSGATTSGSLHLLASASRFIDTRPTSPVNDSSGPFTHNVTRTYTITSLTGSGSVTIPAGATGIVGNITITSSTGAGFAAVYSGTYNNTSTINFASGAVIANNFSTSLTSDGKMSILVRCPNPAGAQVNVAIDIAGYYL